MRENPAPFTKDIENANVDKVLLGVGLALIVTGVVLIPLPRPEFLVLTGGVIAAAVAAPLIRRRPNARSGADPGPLGVSSRRRACQTICQGTVGPRLSPTTDVPMYP